MTDTHSDTRQGEGDRGRTDSEREGLLSALQAERQERQALARQVAELTGKVAAAAAPAKDAPKVYTEAEIQAAVNKGTITEARANEIRTKQTQDAAVAAAKQAAKDELTAERTATQINGDLARWRAALPALLTEGSAERQKANAAYQRLIDRGYPATTSTELTAVEMAFGSIEAMEAARPRGERETHQETGGGSGGGNRGGSGEGWPKDMPAKNRQYYERMIAKGSYTKDRAIKEWSNYPRKAA